MAKETKAEKQEREALEKLPEIVTATKASATGYLFTDFLIHSSLVEKGLVEINEAITNEAGEVATRATQKGIETIMTNANQNSEVPAAGKPVYAIEKGVPIPATTRGGRGNSSYPFDALEVGDSFFIPVSEKHPDPAKSLASTVSGATARYDVVSETETTTTRKGNVIPKRTHTRKFILRAVEGGARVFRTA